MGYVKSMEETKPVKERPDKCCWEKTSEKTKNQVQRMLNVEGMLFSFYSKPENV